MDTHTESGTSAKTRKRKRASPLATAIERQTIVLKTLDKLPSDHDSARWKEVYDSNVDKLNFNFAEIQAHLNNTPSMKVEDLLGFPIETLEYDKKEKEHQFYLDGDDDEAEKVVSIRWSEIEHYVMTFDHSKMMRLVARKFFTTEELKSYDKLDQDDRLSVAKDYICKMVNTFIRNSKNAELLKFGIFRHNLDDVKKNLTSTFCTLRSELRRKKSEDAPPQDEPVEA